MQDCFMMFIRNNMDRACDKLRRTGATKKILLTIRKRNFRDIS